MLTMVMVEEHISQRRHFLIHEQYHMFAEEEMCLLIREAMPIA